MRKVLFFLMMIVALYCGSRYFGRSDYNPQVVAKGVIQQKNFAVGLDSFYVEINHRKYTVERVFSDQGSWVYPKKDSVVTAFVTENNPHPRFMEGKVGKNEIETAFEHQTARNAGIIAMLALLAISYWHTDENDDELPMDKKS